MSTEKLQRTVQTKFNYKCTRPHNKMANTFRNLANQSLSLVMNRNYSSANLPAAASTTEVDNGQRQRFFLWPQVETSFRASLIKHEWSSTEAQNWPLPLISCRRKECVEFQPRFAIHLRDVVRKHRNNTFPLSEYEQNFHSFFPTTVESTSPNMKNHQLNFGINYHPQSTIHYSTTSPPKTDLFKVTSELLHHSTCRACIQYIDLLLSPFRLLL
jgi:hypothetical protein